MSKKQQQQEYNVKIFNLNFHGMEYEVMVAEKKVPFEVGYKEI